MAGRGTRSVAGDESLADAPVGHVELARAMLAVRGVALVVSLLTAQERPLAAPVWVAALVVTGTSAVALTPRAVQSVVLGRPWVVLLDLVLVLAVTEVLGSHDPFVVAAAGSALLAGVVLPGPAVAATVAALVTTHVVVSRWSSITWVDEGPAAGVNLTMLVAVLLCSGQLVGAVLHRQRLRMLAGVAAREAMAAEEERARLARELHDGLAKSLQAVALGARALSGQLRDLGGPARAQADFVAAAAGRAATEARQLLTVMRVDDPREAFAVAVAGKLSNWQAAHGTPVKITAGSVPDLGRETRHEVMMAITEALDNAARHAPGAAVDVTLGTGDDGGLRVCVRDRGPGFTPEHADRVALNGHFGLRGMAERLQRIGGSCQVISCPGGGTSVTLTLPVHAVEPTEQVLS